MEATAAACTADEAGLVAELQAAGLSVESVWDLVNNSPHPVLERTYVGPYEGAYPILVRHLQERHIARVREGIVRSLTVSDGGSLVADGLFRAFNNERDPGLRWVLANALRTAMPYSRLGKHPEIGQALQRYRAPIGAGHQDAAADDRPDAGDHECAPRPLGCPMTWRSVDRQQDLDELDRSVDWDDAELLEVHGGSGQRPPYPTEINRRGLVALDYHVLLLTSRSEHPLLELAFVECDEFNPAVFREGLRGRVTNLMQVEVGPIPRGIRCSRLLYRWMSESEVVRPRFRSGDVGPSNKP